MIWLYHFHAKFTRYSKQTKRIRERIIVSPIKPQFDNQIFVDLWFFYMLRTWNCFCFVKLKVALFQKVWHVFQISKSPKNKYSKSLSWIWNLNFLLITVNNKFKFQAQDSNMEYFYFEDLEIWKMIHTFWKKHL